MRVDKVCERCGKEYQVIPSLEKRNHFCSKACFMGSIAIDPNETKLCECGCGELIPLRNGQYRKMRFKNGHQRRKPKVEGICECGCGERVVGTWHGRPKRFVKGHNWRGKRRDARLEPKKVECACGCKTLIDEFKRDENGQLRRISYAKGHGKRRPSPEKVQKYVFCACGCGQQIMKYDGKWREQKYIVGHNSYGNTWNIGRPSANKGKRLPQMSGSNNPNWRGGISPLAKMVRKLFAYEEWRTNIFTRDQYTCVLCGAKNGNGKTVRLEADHYPKTFNSLMRQFNIASTDDALACEELWDTNNGRTLCKPCHESTPTYGRPFRQLFG